MPLLHSGMAKCECQKQVDIHKSLLLLFTLQIIYYRTLVAQGRNVKKVREKLREDFPCRQESSLFATLRQQGAEFIPFNDWL